MLMSEQVQIQHQPSAKELVQKAGDAAIKKYKDISGRECKLDYKGDLDDNSAGGIIGSIMNGRIKVDNTLDERLSILGEQVSGLMVLGGQGSALIACAITWGLGVLSKQMLPEIKTDLFGKNPNRKFYTVSIMCFKPVTSMNGSDKKSFASIQ